MKVLKAIGLMIFVALMAPFSPVHRISLGSSAAENYKAVFIRRVGSGSNYEFIVNGENATFRCSYCPFELVGVQPGEVVDVSLKSGYVQSIRTSDGRIIDGGDLELMWVKWILFIAAPIGILSIAIDTWRKKYNRGIT